MRVEDVCSSSTFELTVFAAFLQRWLKKSSYSVDPGEAIVVPMIS